MTNGEFRSSKAGALVARWLDNDATIRKMVDLAREGRPPLEALDSKLAGHVVLDNVERQHVGRWIRDILADHGWKVKGQERLEKGQVFTSGSVYQQHRGANPPSQSVELNVGYDPDFASRLARAQEIVRKGTRNDYSVDDFIADKHRESEEERARDQ